MYSVRVAHRGTDTACHARHTLDSRIVPADWNNLIYSFI